MKPQLEQLLAAALRNTPAELGLASTDPGMVTVERTRDTQHGDFATNIAMRLAKTARRNPRDLAKAIVAALPASPLIAKTEIAGAGFINFFLTPAAYAQELARVHELGARYGESNFGKRRKTLVEFVSANPTGPLHVAHGRHAAYGASLANLLEKAGFAVHREYYINDAGRQMDILAASLWLRYLEAWGEPIAFPSGGYQGEYLRPVAEELKGTMGDRLRRPAAEVFANLPPDGTEEARDAHVDAVIARARALLGDAAFQQVFDIALEKMLAGIRNDLEEFGVTFDRWFSERSLETSGAINRALDKLQSQDRLYRKDGALWFRASEFGDEKDRVVVRENGQKTYFASDIAYHFDKRERGFELLIDVLGSGHHGYIARVRAGLLAMGEPGDCLEVPLIQVVTLYRGHEQVQMSKRSGQFVTLRQLRTEVGNDACRIFFLMRDNDQPLDFDLDLATSKNNENPVFYVQYAHARVASMLKELGARGFGAFDLAAGLASFDLLKSPHEQAVLVALTRFPEMIEQAAAARAPHAVVHYLRELANTFHTYYNAEKVLVDDANLRNARLALVVGVQQVIRNGLTLLGASAPESM